jgi:hypothetical protein
MVDVFIIIMME